MRSLRTVAERAADGRAARRRVARRTYGAWRPADDRPDPVAVLVAQAESRVADLIPLRHQRMAESPFAFYRGACAVMAADLGALPTTGLEVQMCGDAHLLNFGGFAAPDRRLVFSLNDFDETMRGPFEWDVQRLAASFAIAGRANGFAAGRRRAVLRTLLREYRQSMATFA